MSRIKKAVLGAFGSRLMAQAGVDDVDVISNKFRLITLSSDKFRAATIQPAAKVRVNVGNWEMRAYTPHSIDAAAGRVQLLVYRHGEGPGSIWAQSAVPGDMAHIIGPQPSLNLAGLPQRAVFFGDETSFAVAKSLRSSLTLDKSARLIFEISSEVEAQTVVERLALGDVQYHIRQADDAHIPLVAEEIKRALVSLAASHLVLTGNGHSIQAIRACLRSDNFGNIGYHVKAYWVPGKTGLE